MTVTPKKFQKVCTPEGKEKRFKKLQAKRLRQREKRKGKKNEDENAEGQPPNKTEVEMTACTKQESGKKLVKKKVEKKKIVTPLESLPDDVREIILLKKEKNRLRRKKDKKARKERIKAEQSLLKSQSVGDEDNKSSERTTKKAKRKPKEDSSFAVPAGKVPKKEERAISEFQDGEVEAKSEDMVGIVDSKMNKLEKKKRKLAELKKRTKLKKQEITETVKNGGGGDATRENDGEKNDAIAANENKMEKERRKKTKLRERSRQKKKVLAQAEKSAGPPTAVATEEIAKTPLEIREGREDKEEQLADLVSRLERKLKKNPAEVSASRENIVMEEVIEEVTETELTNPTINSTPSPPSKSDHLKAKLKGQLDGAKFRFINEKLYTMSSEEAVDMFRDDPDAFHVYHRGYSQQIGKWPVNPVDVIIGDLKKLESSKKIVDFGCGEAKLAKVLAADGLHEVTSYDLVATNEFVTACDMRKCPLPDNSVDIAVFCLSLMGTNMVDFIREANRILKKDGVLKIAEVESRCKDLKQFLRDLQKCGFKVTSKNLDHKVFFLIDLKKSGITKVSDSFPLGLEPCYYKKR